MTADAERPRLRELRTALGWTQQEMAERIAHLAWMERRERVGVNADMVAKWERGAKGISPRYRELLCRLFGVTPDQLGLKSTPAAARSRIDDQSLVAMLDHAAGLLDQLGAARTALAPHILHAWKDAVTNRRTMLGLLDPGATDPAGHARAATATVADLEQLAERYHAVYETADPPRWPRTYEWRREPCGRIREPMSGVGYCGTSPRSQSSPAGSPPMTSATSCPAVRITAWLSTLPVSCQTTNSPPLPMDTLPNLLPVKAWPRPHWTTSPQAASRPDPLQPLLRGWPALRPPFTQTETIRSQRARPSTARKILSTSLPAVQPPGPGGGARSGGHASPEPFPEHVVQISRGLLIKAQHTAVGEVRVQHDSRVFLGHEQIGEARCAVCLAGRHDHPAMAIARRTSDGSAVNKHD